MANKTLNRLELTLGQAVSGLEQLTALLSEELSALGDENPARLETVVARKVELLASIEPDLVRLERQLDALGLSAPDRETAERLAARPETAAIARLWLDLHKLATEVERRNLVNGQLAQQHERSTRAALAILTGRDNEDPTYSASGANRSRLAANSLAKA